MAQEGGRADDAVRRTRGGLIGMWVRSAFWVGRAKPGAEARFTSLVNTVLVPQIAILPGVQAAKALWPVHREDNPPDIACQILVEFESREHVERMLASAERRAMREHVVEIIALFDGTISHIDYEVA